MLRIRKFAQRQDSEHEQALIRVGLAFFALVFLIITYAFTGKTDGKFVVLTAAVLYLMFAMALFLILFFHEQPSPLRRYVGIVVDTGIVTFALAISGDIGAPLYGGYLWVTIANGFRYGNRYLYATQALSILGFSYVILSGEFWQQYLMFGVGLWIWMLVIPPYVSMLLRRLGEARANAEQANAAKSQFLANMSHELRTPLNAIIGYSEMLEEDSLENGHLGYVDDLKKIHYSGNHLLGLINEILDIAKIEEGRMELCLERVNIPQLVNEVASTIQPLAAKNANHLNVELAPGVAKLHTDRAKLHQVLLNLLSNACKFTEGGDVSLRVEPQQLSGKAWLCFTVADTGIGIAADKLDAIFQPFVQENHSIAKLHGGTGLGLAISRNFCELLGGSLKVTSSQGKGSIFTVLLPTAA